MNFRNTKYKEDLFLKSLNQQQNEFFLANNKATNNELIAQCIRFKHAILRDFETEVLNNDYIGTDNRLK